MLPTRQPRAIGAVTKEASCTPTYLKVRSRYELHVSARQRRADRALDRRAAVRVLAQRVRQQRAAGVRVLGERQDATGALLLVDLDVCCFDRKVVVAERDRRRASCRALDEPKVPAVLVELCQVEFGGRERQHARDNGGPQEPCRRRVHDGRRGAGRGRRCDRAVPRAAKEKRWSEASLT